VSENRKHPRKAIELPVGFQQGEGEIVEAWSRDIGIGGMFISTETPAPYGARLKIYMELPGVQGDATIESTVRWTEKGGMGVQFGVMGVRETHAILQIIRSADATSSKR
jgi:PilZ domain